MLVVFNELLSGHPGVLAQFHARFRHLIVDEFQDNSEPQSQLLKVMVNPLDPQITVVGDDDQCIYAFRGVSARWAQPQEDNRYAPCPLLPAVACGLACGRLLLACATYHQPSALTSPTLEPFRVLGRAGQFPAPRQLLPITHARRQLPLHRQHLGGRRDLPSRLQAAAG